MAAADLFGPDWVSLWVTGVALLALAVWLYLLDVSNAPQRVFALLLALRGITFMLGPLRAEAETGAGSALWANLAPYAILPVVPLVVAFLSLYPRRRGLGNTRWGMPALLVATLALEAWYVLDHAAYATVVASTPAQYTDYGPLFLFLGLRLPALAFAGFVLAKDYAREPRGSLGFSLFLMVAAFTLNGLYDGMLAVLELARALEVDPTMWSSWTWTRWWLPVLALPISLATCLRLVPVLRRARSDPELQEVVRFFLFAMPLAVVSAFARELPYSGADQLAAFILAVWRLAIPLLLAYALLRYQLFGIDLHLKDGVRRGIVLGAFTVTFFLVSEAAQSLLAGNRGTAFGIAAGGFLALASRPVQGFANRVADGLMPDTKPIAEQTYAERLRFYQDQHDLIRHDGEVTAKERRMLERLQRALALPDEAVRAIERGDQLPETATASTSQAEGAAPADSGLELAIKAALAAGALTLVFGMLSQGIQYAIPAAIPLSNQAAGLLAAAAVGLMLGPLEGLADRLTHRLDPRAATEARDEKERHRAFASALRTALEDGSLSERDLQYLASLQSRLRISRATRWRLERRARRGQAA